MGYTGQLYDLVALQVSTSPTTVQETATRQLVALGQFNDDTVANMSDAASWRVVTGALV